jgi:hypothetical protein
MESSLLAGVDKRDFGFLMREYVKLVPHNEKLKMKGVIID